jgi:ADP-heptose:LPS heptosyltransferase
VGGITLKQEHKEHELRYLLGLLNSKLFRWYFPFVSAPFRGGYLSANRQFLSQLPNRTINFSDPVDKARHDRMVELVERMLELNKRKARCSGDVSSPKPPGERSSPLQHFGERRAVAASYARRPGERSSPLQLEQIDREIAATDTEIDELVYELYGITDAERRIVEGAL